MLLTFSDFNQDISKLIKSNDTLWFLTPIEPIKSYHTTKASATTEVEIQLKTKMAEPIHDVMPTT